MIPILIRPRRLASDYLTAGIAESATLSRKLQQLEPIPPFHFFDLGLAAMRSGEFKAARALFEKEVERDAYYHEFRAWLAAAYLGLGETTQARVQLVVAMKNSATRTERDFYSAKLDWIRPRGRPQSVDGSY